MIRTLIYFKLLTPMTGWFRPSLYSNLRLRNRLRQPNSCLHFPIRLHPCLKYILHLQTKREAVKSIRNHTLTSREDLKVQMKIKIQIVNNCNLNKTNSSRLTSQKIMLKELMMMKFSMRWETLIKISQKLSALTGYSANSKDLEVEAKLNQTKVR